MHAVEPDAGTLRPQPESEGHRLGVARRARFLPRDFLTGFIGHDGNDGLPAEAVRGDFRLEGDRCGLEVRLVECNAPHGNVPRHGPLGR